VLIDPEGLPGIYMARIVAMLDVCDKMSSTNASGLDPPVVGKSPLVKSKVPPNEKVVAGSDDIASCTSKAPVAYSDGGFLKVGAGESQPGLPEGGSRIAAINHENDLQIENSSLPVENG